MLRAHERGIQVVAIHNASIMNAIGACGLALYNYGQAISIVFFTDTWKPDSFYDKIKQNQSLGLHSLLLLDIKVKEQSIENLARGRKIYEPPRFMSIAQCIDQLYEVEELRQENGTSIRLFYQMMMSNCSRGSEILVVETLRDCTLASFARRGLS